MNMLKRIDSLLDGSPIYEFDQDDIVALKNIIKMGEQRIYVSDLEQNKTVPIGVEFDTIFSDDDRRRAVSILHRVNRLLPEQHQTDTLAKL